MTLWFAGQSDEKSCAGKLLALRRRRIWCRYYYFWTEHAVLAVHAVHCHERRILTASAWSSARRSCSGLRLRICAGAFPRSTACFNHFVQRNRGRLNRATAAHLFGLVPSVVMGGIGTLIVVAVTAYKCFRKLKATAIASGFTGWNKQQETVLTLHPQRNWWCCRCVLFGFLRVSTGFIRTIR